MTVRRIAALLAAAVLASACGLPVNQGFPNGCPDVVSVGDRVVVSISRGYSKFSEEPLENRPQGTGVLGPIIWTLSGAAQALSPSGLNDPVELTPETSDGWTWLEFEAVGIGTIQVSARYRAAVEPAVFIFFHPDGTPSRIIWTTVDVTDECIISVVDETPATHLEGSWTFTGPIEVTDGPCDDDQFDDVLVFEHQSGAGTFDEVSNTQSAVDIRGRIVGDLVTFSSVRPASSTEHTHFSFELTVEDDNTMVGTEEWIWIEGFGRPDEQRCTGVSTLTATRNP